jgi:uncharacterized membrane protein
MTQSRNKLHPRAAIATPALRVALSVGFFIAERDRFYVVTTLLVLAVLLVVSFVLGAG